STIYATNITDVTTGTGRDPFWELDGYSRYTNGLRSDACIGHTDYVDAPFYGYTQGPGYYGKTFFIWPPDPRRPLTTASHSTKIQQFLTDLGYTSTDFSDALTGPPLNGVFNVTSTPGSQLWPWPADGGVALSNYLLSQVYIPGGARLLNNSDIPYLRIMR